MAHVTGSTAAEVLGRVKSILEAADKKIMSMYGSIEAAHHEAVRPQIKFEAEDQLDLEAADLLVLAGQATWLTDKGPPSPGALGGWGSFVVHVASESSTNAQNATRASLLLMRKVEDLQQTVLELSERVVAAESRQLEAAPKDKARKALPASKAAAKKSSR